jgi:hypothetical protein
MAALESPSMVGDWCPSKAIFYWRYVGKVLFLKRIFPKVGNPVLSGRQKGVFLQYLTTARQDDVRDVPVIFSNLAMNGPSAHSRIRPGSFGYTSALPLFSAVRVSRVRRHFQMWGCFLGSK